MDREYLEDYEQKEKAEWERLLRNIQKRSFSLERDEYPPDSRFIKIKKPISHCSDVGKKNIWAQIPLSGSLIVILHPEEQEFFNLCEIREIPKVIDFIKETGRLQIALSRLPCEYEGLDFLEPFFMELSPPVYGGPPMSVYTSKKEILEAQNTFFTLAEIKYLDLLKELSNRISSRLFSRTFHEHRQAYVTLKLMHYLHVEEIENSIVDNPRHAWFLLTASKLFLTDPVRILRPDIRNYTTIETRLTQTLPFIYRPSEIRFPCEIGKFLLKKLTYAAQDMRACYNLLDNYADYDLQKIQESLNEGIVTNHPDIVSKSAEEFSEILDNVWSDPIIPRQIKNLRKGVPMSIAAIGTAVSAFTGTIEGFLAGLGFSVGAKFLDAEIEGLSERVVKFFSRSYQANVYDFKKKYKIE